MRAQTERQTIHIPPAAAHVASIRAFVGAIGRHVGCSAESIDDLRLAATEACAQALEEDAASDGIEVRTSFGGGRLLLEVEPCGLFEPSPELDGVWGVSRRALIEGLFPEAEFERGGGRGLLRLTVPNSTA
jgi:anti-sigma regulatory factor (Ser/Thr protein kinase)